MINVHAFILKKNGEPNCNCICRCPELVENYAEAIADDTQTWDVHHRKEEFYSQKELMERGEYYDVEPEALIFLTREEHRKIDSKCKRNGEAHKGRKHSEEHIRKIAKAKSKKVLCVETGELFESIQDVYRKTGIHQSSISAVCKGKRKTAGGYHWKYLSNTVIKARE